MKSKHANIAFFVPHAGCPHSCSFCNQKQISGQHEALTVEMIIKTLKDIKPDLLRARRTELAFFGGSFTAIERDKMTAYLEAANKFKNSHIFEGIRISTRPDAISDEILELLKRYNVTFIELGAQSTDDTVLAFNQRGHTARDIREASHKVKNYGFSLGLQMMTGLYKSTIESDIKTCEDIIALKPDTVRIYPTVIIKGTRLDELYRSGEYTVQTLPGAVSLCARLLRMFYDAGIRVIRLGLHSGGAVEEGYTAGPYHPAFGELCESRLYLDSAFEKLYLLPKGQYTIFVEETQVSKMIGQKRMNIDLLKREGYNCTVKGKSAVARYETEIEKKRNGETDVFKVIGNARV